MTRRSGSSPPVPEDRIALGVIRKPHGVHGEASVEPWTTSHERFGELDRVFLVSPDQTEARELSVASWRSHGDRVLTRFEEISTPEEMRTLRGWTIEVPASESRTLEEGEYFIHDLLGLELTESGTGRRIGKVTDAIEGPGGMLLVVSRPDGGTFDLPFARSICRSIDLNSRSMIVDLPEGLEELNAAAMEAPEEPRERDAEEISTEAPEGTLDQEPLPYRIDLVTIFPAMFEPLLNEGIISRGVRSGRLAVRVWDLREHTTDRHRSTDDEAYGGGAGMVMLAEPVFRCVEAIRGDGAEGHGEPLVIMMSPQGSRLEHGIAQELGTEHRWLVVLCGRYEGFDERVREALVDREISVGDFVVAGGEIPAMLLVEAVCRFVDGVVGDRNSVEADSFYNGLLDYPHYTRPAEFRGMNVPEVLLSGHAERIRKWRKEESLRATLRKRPDLLEGAELDDEAERMLEVLRREVGGGEHGTG